MNARTVIKMAKDSGISTIELLKAIIECEEGENSLINSERVEKEFKKDDQESLLKIITSILRKIGTPTGIYGYNYLREAIKYCLETEAKSMMKEIYPHVATMFDTTTGRVERSIRHSIQSVEKEDNKELYYYLGRKKSGFTNSQFIFGLADYIKTYIL